MNSKCVQDLRALPLPVIAVIAGIFQLKFYFNNKTKFQGQKQV